MDSLEKVFTQQLQETFDVSTLNPEVQKFLQEWALRAQGTGVGMSELQAERKKIVVDFHQTRYWGGPASKVHKALLSSAGGIIPHLPNPLIKLCEEFHARFLTLGGLHAVGLEVAF